MLVEYTIRVHVAYPEIRLWGNLICFPVSHIYFKVYSQTGWEGPWPELPHGFATVGAYKLNMDLYTQKPIGQNSYHAGEID